MEPRRQSQLVTTLAWIFLSFAVFGVLTSGAQTLVAFTALPNAEVHRALLSPEARRAIPGPLFFFLVNARWIALIFFATSAITFWGAVAFLRRREWGRLFFIWFLALGVAGNLAGSLLPLRYLAALPPLPEDLVGLRSTLAAIAAGASVIAIIYSGFSVWVIFRLGSPDVRAEFRE
jgi:hypothetical protein